MRYANFRCKAVLGSISLEWRNFGFYKLLTWRTTIDRPLTARLPKVERYLMIDGVHDVPSG